MKTKKCSTIFELTLSAKETKSLPNTALSVFGLQSHLESLNEVVSVESISSSFASAITVIKIRIKAGYSDEEMLSQVIQKINNLTKEKYGQKSITRIKQGQKRCDR